MDRLLEEDTTSISQMELMSKEMALIAISHIPSTTAGIKTEDHPTQPFVDQPVGATTARLQNGKFLKSNLQTLKGCSPRKDYSITQEEELGAEEVCSEEEGYDIEDIADAFYVLFS